MSIRFGIVGTGNIAHRFAKAIQAVPEARLFAIASRSKEKAEAFAEEFHIPHAFGSYEEMAASSEIDAAYIAVPHGEHLRCTCLMLQHKKHVLCEKPMGVNQKEVQVMIDCAKQNQCFLMEAMWARFVPGTEKLFSLLEQGIIGDIRSVDAQFCYAFPEGIATHHVFKNENGGGALLDVGIYCLNFVSWILGKDICRLEATTQLCNQTDALTEILLQYPSGAISHLSCATLLEKPRGGWIYGTKGHIYIPHFYAPEKIDIRLNSGEEQHIETPYTGNGFEQEIAHMCACLQQGLTESPLHPFSQTLYISSLMDTIREKIGLSYPQDQ